MVADAVESALGMVPTGVLSALVVPAVLALASKERMPTAVLVVGTLITVNSRSHLLRPVVHLITVIDYRERDPSGRILPVTAVFRVTTIVHLPTRCFPLNYIPESLATDTTNRVPVSIEIH